MPLPAPRRLLPGPSARSRPLLAGEILARLAPRRLRSLEPRTGALCFFGPLRRAQPRGRDGAERSAAGRGGAVRGRGWPHSSRTRAEGGAVPGKPGELRGGGRGRGGRGGRPPTSVPAGGDKGSGSPSPQHRWSPGNRPRPLCPGGGSQPAGVELRSLRAIARPAARRVPKPALAPTPVPMRVAALPAAWPVAGGSSGRRVASLRARLGAAPERHELGAAPRLAAPRPV